MLNRMYDDIRKEIENILDKKAPEMFDFLPKGTKGFTIFGGADKLIRRSDRLRKSFVQGYRDNYSNVVITDNKLVITRGSKVPYARIHELGGQIEITSRMRKFFWWQYFINRKKNPLLAYAWKVMALFKEVIKMPQRPYLSPALSNIQKLITERLTNKIGSYFKLEITKDAQTNT